MFGIFNVNTSVYTKYIFIYYNIIMSLTCYKPMNSKNWFLRPFSPPTPPSGSTYNNPSSCFFGENSHKFLLLLANSSRGQMAMNLDFPCLHKTYTFLGSFLKLSPGSEIIIMPHTRAQWAVWPCLKHGEWLKSASYLIWY